jgi:hypothetical protein
MWGILRSSTFSILAGIVAPIVCLALQPVLLVLLPFSLIGLLVIIGVLGLVPFLTAAAYYAHAVQAYRQAREVAGEMWLLGSALLGALLVVGVPGAVPARVSLAVRWAIRDVAAGDPTALARLRTWYRFAHRDRLVWAYAAERDPVRWRRLAEAYKELTGEDVESKLTRIVD